jgi:hypothetical protein
VLRYVVLKAFRFNPFDANQMEKGPTASYSSLNYHDPVNKLLDKYGAESLSGRHAIIWPFSKRKASPRWR